MAVTACLVTACSDASPPPSARPLQQDVSVPAEEPSVRKLETRGTPPPSASARPDAGPPDPGYRDPAAQDGGCSAPNKVCGGRCVSIANEVGHCGDCGRACIGGGAICVASTCACTQTGFQYCAASGGCIDVTADNANCGTCGRACAGNEACENGDCVDQGK